MTSARTIAREQIDWWKAEKINAIEAMEALGLHCTEATWGEVELVAEHRYKALPSAIERDPRRAA